MFGAPNRELRLKEAINKLDRSYDYILIDCPPSLGLLTLNSLMASTEIFIPIDMGYFSLQGAIQLMEIIELVREQTNHEIRVKAIATMYDKRTRISKEILRNLRAYFKESMFNSVINSNVKLREAASFGETIVEYDKMSQGFKDYIDLTVEVIEEEKLEHLKPIKEQEEPSSIPYLIEKRFVYHAPEAKSIKIVGNFDHRVFTGELLMDPKGDGTWSKAVKLAPGEYQYQYVVDDRWTESKRRIII